MRVVKVVILSLISLFFVSLASGQARAQGLLKPHLPLLPQKVKSRISRYPLPPIRSVAPSKFPLELRNKQSSKSLKMLVPSKAVTAKRGSKEKLKRLYLFRRKIRLDLAKKRKVITRERLLFHQELKKLKDKEKERIISNIGNKLDQLNDRLVERLTNASDKLLKIEAVLEKKTELLEGKGVNVSRLKEKETEFKVEVEEYKNNLLLQKGKSYLPNLKENKNLGQAVRQVLMEFKNDFRKLRFQFHNLRKELVDIIRLMEQLKRENMRPTPVVKKGVND